MKEYQSIPVREYPEVLKECIRHASLRESKPVEDCIMWSQRWPNMCCGWNATTDDVHIWTWAPTVVVKFDRLNRYVYHDGKFAYHLKGETTLQYYDAIRARNLPGVDDTYKLYLVNGAQ